MPDTVPTVVQGKIEEEDWAVWRRGPNSEATSYGRPDYRFGQGAVYDVELALQSTEAGVVQLDCYPPTRWSNKSHPNHRGQKQGNGRLAVSIGVKAFH